MTELIRPEFPHVLDNTMRVAFCECPRKFFHRHIMGRVMHEDSADLHAGGCFARGIETVRWNFYGPKKLSLDESLILAFKDMAAYWGSFDSGDSVKSFHNTVRALEFYFRDPKAYIPSMDHIKPMFNAVGEPAVEWNFVVPIQDGLVHPETGEPLLYTGRFDMFGIYRDDLPVLVDEKTTKQLGSQWAAKWRMRSQFTGYIWGAQQYGHKLNTAVIRGISFLKNGHETQEVIVQRPAWHVEMWHNQLVRDVKRMLSAWESGYFDMDLADACGSYGGCMFIPICDSPTPENWYSHYKHYRWNPLKLVERRIST